ncbi:hypothetical protein HDU98_007226 [Podochytrium sp. JEL0797]|nr:hypothetical protein HDU98_007226 [Podochytrium sp. JEL0797]
MLRCFHITSLALLLALAAVTSADVCSLTEKVNAYRDMFALPHLVLDTRLVQIAQEHSEIMAHKHVTNPHQASDALIDDHADLDQHDRIEKLQESWYADIEELIPNWTFLAENVAMGSQDENAILDLFKNTEDYNYNLLSEEASLLGIGEKDGYWTFEFAGTADLSVNEKYAVYCYN